MKRRESLEQLVARVSANSFIPNDVEICNMATKVHMPRGKKFEFKSGRGKASNYNFDEWFKVDPKTGEGDVLLLTQSKGKCNDKGTVVEVEEKGDFDIPVNFMTSKLIWTARKRYLVCQISRRDFEGAKLPTGGKVKDGVWFGNGGGQLIIQARKMTDEEVEEENRKRAEAKANKDAKDNGDDDDEDENEDSDEAE